MARRSGIILLWRQQGWKSRTQFQHSVIAGAEGAADFTPVGQEKQKEIERDYAAPALS
jgi:hypothetical protein